MYEWKRKKGRWLSTSAVILGKIGLGLHFQPDITGMHAPVAEGRMRIVLELDIAAIPASTMSVIPAS